MFYLSNLFSDLNLTAGNKMLSKNVIFSGIIVASVFIFSGCGESSSDKVKNGVLKQYSNNITVGQALDAWAKTQGCASTKWENIVTEQGAKVAQFTCELNVAKMKTPEAMASTLKDEDAVKAYEIMEDLQNKFNIAESAVDKQEDAIRYVRNTTGANYNHSIALAMAQIVGAIDKKTINQASEYDSAKAAFDEAELNYINIISVLARKNMKAAKIEFQFILSADGQTFTEDYQGGEMLFNDGKKCGMEMSLQTVYKNMKAIEDKTEFGFVYAERE